MLRLAKYNSKFLLYHLVILSHFNTKSALEDDPRKYKTNTSSVLYASLAKCKTDLYVIVILIWHYETFLAN